MAQRIVKGEAPEGLRGKKILSLDLASLLAGSKFRGEFEERIKKLLKELTEKDDYILFIDELHTIIGAGKAEGTVDAGGGGGGALARGELRCIGATTPPNTAATLKKMPPWNAAFNKSPSPNPRQKTPRILRGLREKYEAHHGVRISDPAIVAAVELSNRYISERF